MVDNVSTLQQGSPSIASEETIQEKRSPKERIKRGLSKNKEEWIGKETKESDREREAKKKECMHIPPFSFASLSLYLFLSLSPSHRRQIGSVYRSVTSRLRVIHFFTCILEANDCIQLACFNDELDT